MNNISKTTIGFLALGTCATFLFSLPASNANAQITAPSLGSPSNPIPADSRVPAEVLLKLRSSANNLDVGVAEQLADADRDEEISRVDNGSIRLLHSRSKGVDQLIAALSQLPAVAYVEPNYIGTVVATPNDPLYGQLWGLKNTGQVINGRAGTAGADISAELAWNVTTGSRCTVVGVVDTGIDYNHQDLAANVWSNDGTIGGCAAGTHGYNAITKTCDPLDDYASIYHGTHVSGTIGAVGNNSVGVVGVNWNTSIMGLKWINQYGYGVTSDAISAIEFAVKAKIAGVNVRVLSNSWRQLDGFSQALLDEINRANTNDILFVAAAGNNSSNNDITPLYPASYNAPNIVAVAATDNNDNLASFSNYGPTKVHLGAPGVDVLSTKLGNAYQYLSGTSMATPHVSGVAALILSKSPSLTTAQVKSNIVNNVDVKPSLVGRTASGGRLNAAKALGSLVSAVSRKTHGTAGTFDIDLPLTGNSGIECRSGGGTGAYTMIFTFSNTLVNVGGVSVAPCGSVSSSTPGPNANQYTVNLTGVCNAQYITVTLTDVRDSAGGDFNVAQSMGVLLGDTTANGFVNSADIAQTQSQTRQAVTTSNFREDVDANGVIDGNDVSLVQSESGTALPARCENGSLDSVVSRKVHGSAGTFDIDLPLTGNPGIECRSGGTNGDYAMVFTFSRNVTSVANGSVTCGSVGSSGIGPNPNQYTVNLSGENGCNAQYITVMLTAVRDSAGAVFNAASTMGLLIGDTTADGFVNSADISQTQSQTRQAVTTSNFREDVDANGVIDGNDVSLVQSKSGTALPTPP
jgi:subtilisin family serine protease